MSLKLLLNLMITALMAVLLVIGVGLTIHNSQENIRAELESTSALALHLIDKELLYFADEIAEKRLKTPFSLSSLGQIRHLRVEYYDAQGRLRDSNQIEFSASVLNPAPQWFIYLMNVFSTDVEPRKRIIHANNNLVGEIVITPDPSYEITEVWEDSLGMLKLVGIFFVSVNIMVFWAVSKALKPVDEILEAINELERGNLDARLPAFRLPELTQISMKFNHMAETLQKSITRNHKLSQQLLHLQEEERKSLSRDLHDEIGQSLTAIHADASAILNASRPDTPVHQGAQAIVSVARQVISIVRNIVERLRPETLDKLGLEVALEELVSAWQQRYKPEACDLQITSDLRDIPEAVSITAYRMVQECLTNVARHANARQVSVNLWIENDELAIVVQDDGCGFNPKLVSGFGLIGIRERITAANGELEIDSNLGKGTTIMARLLLNGRDK
ncbi:two-component system, NarL family, sensor histidine kinase UhpB [Methylophilaceae bacterium]|nr:two-component system, NarL family, sensor histidine kinase UhpB [Methylophilaceae bacterium]